jgi:hypothetical protein
MASWSQVDSEAIIGDKGGPGPVRLFRADVSELVVVRLNENRDKLVIESWHEGRGASRRER